MAKQNVIVFNDYDKITDNLIWFSSDIVLRFMVQLSVKSREGTRQSFHQEYSYTSKFLDTSLSRQIRRNIDCALLIDIKGDFNNSVMIRYQNMVMLKLKLQTIVQWFTKLFKMQDDGKLYIVGKYKNEQVPMDMGKCIEFEPIVITYDDGKCSEGIRMYVNSKNIWVDMDISKFMAFYYLIDTFDMYQNACLLLNYLQRPEYGYNNYSMSGGSNNNTESFDEFKNEKHDKGDGSKSFFNSI